MNSNRIKAIQWIPFAFLLIGVILKWTRIDEEGILLNIGFISFGLVMLVAGIKAKYHNKQLTADSVKILLPIIVILLSTDSLLTGRANHSIIGVTILFYYMLAQGTKLASKGSN